MAGNAFDHNGEVFLRSSVRVPLGTVRISLPMVVKKMMVIMMMMVMMVMMIV